MVVVQRLLHLLRRLRVQPLLLQLLFMVALVCCDSSVITFSAAAVDESSMSTNSTSIRALLALRQSISTDPSDFLASWDMAAKPSYCHWSGVHCSTEGSGIVVAILLNSHQLNGTLPPELGLLSNLSYLNVSENNFHGSVPAELGKLRKLTHLDLSSNGFTGSIPSSLSNCTLIQYLDLRFNSMSGSFPSFITSFASLTYLDMSRNSFRGERIPSDIGRLSNLQFLQLTNTGVEANIRSLHLRNNFFTGRIPSTLGNCTAMTELELENNTLIGEIPESLSRVTTLKYLVLFSNRLTGAIPESITNCTALLSMQIGRNNLTGSIPAQIGKLRQLVSFSVARNANLSGSLPDSIGACTQMQLFSTRYTQVGGLLPSSIYNLTNLQTLYLTDNAFSGTLTEAVRNWSALITLDLTGNNFHGKIPEAVGFLKGLEGLQLQQNRFEGPIPKIWIGLQLSEIDLSHNLLNGSIPPALGDLPLLNSLLLQNNDLSGSIPDTLQALKTLLELNLSHNHLTGEIPTNLSPSESLDLSFNNLSGRIPASIGDLYMISTIVLAENHLSGPIPDTLGSYQRLLVLDLSVNNLDGDIPSALGELPVIQYIDLSYNGLSGSLPASLGMLRNLVFLNVSFNLLQGQIPTGGVFASISPSAFLGNTGLCGYPVNATCEDDSFKKPSKSPLRHRLLVSISSAIAGLIVLLLCVCSWRYRRRLRLFSMNSMTAENEAAPETELRAWTAKELRDATADFHTANVIGAGGVSVCFKGVLNLKGIDMSVAIKRLNCKAMAGSEIKESFLREIKVLGEVRHRNLVKTLGYCLDGGEMAIVMELMEMGDLRQILGRREKPLSWDRRMNIAMDVAEGLVYLHYECLHPIIHCDLKPQNILLGSDMVAKVSDFGIAKLLESRESSWAVSISDFVGTFGYAAPECGTGPSVSRKVDVYSFGILLMELATGMNPRSSQLHDEGLTLRSWCSNLLASKSLFLLDSPVQETMKIDPTLRPELEIVLRLGLKCTHENAQERPDMKFVREVLTRITKPELAALYQAKQLKSLME
ncbi:hypothetical protein KP509_09G089100 [Ceratopteris richardii]|uniref:Protein kinase domain-containing protein n=1 Tax=Ceratopteris richardii TaxID=49495 RepID=A0A8T2U8X4_CERRI|nr:hypothetical protein KP509_09G089100 [Ceratopteris richardii]